MLVLCYTFCSLWNYPQCLSVPVSQFEQTGHLYFSSCFSEPWVVRVKIITKNNFLHTKNNFLHTKNNFFEYHQSVQRAQSGNKNKKQFLAYKKQFLTYKKQFLWVSLKRSQRNCFSRRNFCFYKSSVAYKSWTMSKEV